jgi:hypothetical protein
MQISKKRASKRFETMMVPPSSSEPACWFRMLFSKNKARKKRISVITNITGLPVLIKKNDRTTTVANSKFLNMSYPSLGKDKVI